MEEYDPKLISGAAQYLKLALSIPRATSLADASSTIQRLEEAVRKYEELGAKPFDAGVKLQRLFDIMPQDLEKHVILESRGAVTTYDSVRRRSTAWIHANMGPASMDLRHLRAQNERYQWWCAPEYTDEQLEQERRNWEHVNQQNKQAGPWQPHVPEPTRDDLNALNGGKKRK